MDNYSKRNLLDSTYCLPLQRLSKSTFILSLASQKFHFCTNFHSQALFAKVPLVSDTVFCKYPIPHTVRSLYKRVWIGSKISFLHHLLQSVRVVAQVTLSAKVPLAKGQIILKANFEVFIRTKNRTKIFLYFCPRTLKWIKSKKYNHYITW